MWLPFGLTPKRNTRYDTRYGDIGARGIAAGIDLFLLFGLFSQLFTIIGRALYKGLDPAVSQALAHAQSISQMLEVFFSTDLSVLWITNAVIQITLIGILMVAVQIYWGTTPGKWLMGLKVVRAKTFEKVGAWRFVLRFLAYLVSCTPLMIGIFWASFNRERRTWHDYIAGTVVLNTRPYGWYWKQAKALVRRLRNKPLPVEQPVTEPAAKEGE